MLKLFKKPLIVIDWRYYLFISNIANLFDCSNRIQKLVCRKSCFICCEPSDARFRVSKCCWAFWAFMRLIVVTSWDTKYLCNFKSFLYFSISIASTSTIPFHTFGCNVEFPLHTITINKTFEIFAHFWKRKKCWNKYPARRLKVRVHSMSFVCLIAFCLFPPTTVWVRNGTWAWPTWEIQIQFQKFKYVISIN